MGFTQQTIIHSFLNADGTPASGEVTFALTKRMTNSGTTYVPATVTASLGSTGALSVALMANDDTGTYPTDAAYEVTFRILGSKPEMFTIQVPSAATSPIDLGSLLPGEETVQ